MDPVMSTTPVNQQAAQTVSAGPQNFDISSLITNAVNSAISNQVQPQAPQAISSTINTNEVQEPTATVTDNMQAKAKDPIEDLSPAKTAEALFKAIDEISNDKEINEFANQVDKDGDEVGKDVFQAVKTVTGKFIDKFEGKGKDQEYFGQLRDNLTKAIPNLGNLIGNSVSFIGKTIARLAGKESIQDAAVRVAHLITSLTKPAVAMEMTPSRRAELEKQFFNNEKPQPTTAA